jgi:uncharacterized protein (TIGR02265 family)
VSDGSDPKDDDIPELSPGFHAFDPHAELDLEAVLARIPDHATVKGMYLNGVVKDARAQGVELEASRYVSLDDYPARDYHALVAQAAAKLHPDVPLREGLRRLGRSAFPTLRESMVGRMVFGVVGDDPAALFKLVSKAWSLSQNTVRAELISAEPGRVVVNMTGFDWFVDDFTLGIFEGVILSTGHTPTVGVRHPRKLETDFECLWR